MEEAAGEILAIELPAKSPELSPEFRAAPVAPTAAAVVAQKEHLVATIAAYRQFISLMTQGIFRLPCAGDGDGDEDTIARGSKKKKRQATSLPRTRGPRRITIQEQQLARETFEGDVWGFEFEPSKSWCFITPKMQRSQRG